MAFEGLAEKLIKLRKSNHLSQQQVADAIGVKRSAYAYYETGKSKPKFPALCNLAKIYGLSVDDLLSNPNADTIAVDPVDYSTPWSIGDTVSELTDYEQYLVLKSRLMSLKDKQTLADYIDNTMLKKK